MRNILSNLSGWASKTSHLPRFIATKEYTVTAIGPGISAKNKNLLDRASVSINAPIQQQVDQMVGGFVVQAADWKSLAALAAGGMAYRLGRIGAIGVGSSQGIRMASLGLGLAAEVSAFEGTTRALNSVGAGSPRPTILSQGAGAETAPLHENNLWRWNGHGGLKHGLLSSLITFGTLKGFGRLAQGQNLILQHGAQDLGMVLGHQLAYRSGIGNKPEGTLAEQFLHAEITNLQLAAGTSLSHGALPRLASMERGLDLHLASKESASSPSFGSFDSPFPLATAKGPRLSLSERYSEPSEIGKEPMAHNGNGSGETSPPPSSRPRPATLFLSPEPGQTWESFLQEKLAVSKEELDAARRTDQLAVSGATIFKWGTARNPKGLLCPPGEILHLLGVVEYLNTCRGGEGVDPFDAIRLTLPEQLSTLRPDAEGNIVIRYPELMKDLDFEHFNLQSFLKLYLASRDQSNDVDLARQWGVSANTVLRYRTGEAKMHLETLERLIEGIISEETNEQNRSEMRNFLMFLRYRPYFEATMDLVHNDRNLSRGGETPASQYGLFLIPREKSLRDLDLTRRIQFEKEPFASAIDGSIETALKLMESRVAEFEMAGDFLSPLTQKIEGLKRGHEAYLNILSQQKKSPGVVQPVLIREIRAFYREFFRAFEAAYLHSRPRGQLKWGETLIDFEVVPPTADQPRGLRIEADPNDAKRLKAYVVAADLMEFSPEPPAHLNDTDQRSLFQAERRGEILKLRLLKAALREVSLWLPGDEHSEANRKILENSFQGMEGRAPSPEAFEQFHDLENKAPDWRPMAIHLSRDAILHRIFRGRPEAVVERRRFQWEEDLRRYIEREEILPAPAQALEAAFRTYADETAHPFKKFNQEAFTKSLLDLPPPLAQVRDHLIAFMKSLGLPTERPPENGTLRPSAESLAQSVFANYLEWFAREHPLRLRQRIVPDEALMDKILNERLIDFSELSGDRQKIRDHVTRLIDEYNGRPHPLSIRELPVEPGAEAEPYRVRPLAQFYHSIQERFLAEHPGSESTLSERLFYGAFRNLRDAFAMGQMPSKGELRVAIDLAAQRLEILGEAPSRSVRAVVFEFLEQATAELHQSVVGVDRLSSGALFFVASKNYQSGLEKTQTLGSDLKDIFHHHALSALLDMEPLPLEITILQVIGERFGPYDKIRAEVVRDLRIIHHEFLGHLREQYGQLEEAFTEALKEAKEHKSAETFWGDFAALASVVEGSIKDRMLLEDRIADLERFLGLMHHPPVLDLSDKIKKGIEDIDALKSASSPHKSTLSDKEIDAVLNAQSSPDFLNQYPELNAVDVVALKNQILELEENGRGDLVKPEARSLLDFLALLDFYREKAHPELQGVLEALALEVLSSPHGKSPQEIGIEAFSEYKKHRDKILSSIPSLSLVGALPEIRGTGRPLNDLQAGPALQHFISQRLLPIHLERIFLEEADKATHEKFSGIEIFVRYFPRIATHYWNYRNSILTSPLIEVGKEDGDLTKTFPNHLKERIAREFPELALKEDESIGSWAQEVDEKIKKSRQVGFLGFNFPTMGHLLGKIGCLTDFLTKRKSPSLSKFYQDILPHYGRIANMVMLMGASAPHTVARTSEQVLEIYKKHRPAILAHLIETVGVEKLAATLPELREVEVESLDFGQEHYGIQIPFFPEWTGIGRMVKILRNQLSAKEAKELEKIIWDWKMPEKASDAEIQKILEPLARKLALFYFQHRRNAVLNDISPEAAKSHKKIEEELEAETKSLWEVQMGRDLLITKGMEPITDPEHHPYPLLPGIPLRKGFVLKSILDNIKPRFSTPIAGMMNALGRLDHNFMLLPIGENQRMALLNLMGLEPFWLYETYGRRILDHYKKERPRFIDKMDFSEDVAKLPEIQAVPNAVMDKLANPLSLSDSTLRILAILYSLEFDFPKNAAKLTREFRQKTERYKKSADHFNKAAARFYLEHRAEILPHLKPWSETKAQEPSLVETVANLPEISTITSKRLGKVRSSVLSATRKTGDDSVQKLLIPENDLFLRVLAVLIHREDFSKGPNKAYLQFMLETKDISPQEANEVAARFYLEHREEISPYLKSRWGTDATRGMDPVEWAFQLPEIANIKDEYLEVASNYISKTKLETGFDSWDHLLLPESELSLRIMAILICSRRSSFLNRGHEVFDRYMEKMKGLSSQEANRVAAEFYLKYREEMVAKIGEQEATEARTLEDDVREISDYPELREIPQTRVNIGIKDARQHGARTVSDFSHMLIRISILMDEPWMPAGIRDRFQSLSKNFMGASEGLTPTRKSEIFAQVVVEFYNTVRDEILAAMPRSQFNKK